MKEALRVARSNCIARGFIAGLDDGVFRHRNREKSVQGPVNIDIGFFKGHVFRLVGNVL